MTDRTAVEKPGGDIAHVRIAPVAPEDRSPEQRRLLEPVRGDDAANVFATMAAHPKLFEAWLPFCIYLLRCPDFSPRHREMVILRTAWLCGTHYEWVHHVNFALGSGMTEDEIRSLSDTGGANWSSEERALIDAVDELHAQHALTTGTWNRLAAFLTTEQLIVLPMLVGQYTMLGGALNALGVAVDDGAAMSTSMGWGER
jgi:4-carboxymuconolactone decarboxylase